MYELLIVAAIVAIFILALIILDVILGHYDSVRLYKCPNCGHVFKSEESLHEGVEKG
jgi:hypothetical protein